MRPDRETVREKLAELQIGFDEIEEFITDCELSHIAFWSVPAEPNPLDGTRLWDKS